jgi:hypothetical protein
MRGRAPRFLYGSPTHWQTLASCAGNRGLANLNVSRGILGSMRRYVGVGSRQMGNLVLDQLSYARHRDGRTSLMGSAAVPPKSSSAAPKLPMPPARSPVFVAMSRGSRRQPSGAARARVARTGCVARQPAVRRRARRRPALCLDVRYGARNAFCRRRHCRPRPGPKRVRAVAAEVGMETYQLAGPDAFCPRAQQGFCRQGRQRRSLPPSCWRRTLRRRIT